MNECVENIKLIYENLSQPTAKWQAERTKEIGMWGRDRMRKGRRRSVGEKSKGVGGEVEE